jgi:excisionase family DNA binding protein
LLTVKEAALAKGVHPKSIYRAITEGRLPATTLYGVKLIQRADLWAWKPKGPGPRKEQGK